MTWVDYAILATIFLSALVGLGRGFVREVLSLGIWLGALLLAWFFYRDVAELLVPYLSQSSVRLAVAFAALILATLIAGAILGALLSALIERTGLTGVDRLLGLGFGTARAFLIVAMAVFLGELTPLKEDSAWQDANFVGDFRTLADWMIDLVPEEVQARIQDL